MIALIVVSVLLMLVEVAFVRDPAVELWLERAGRAITAIFAVELSLRFWVAEKKSRFFRHYWLDLLSLLPLLQAVRGVRVLRLLRIFRAGVLLNRYLAGFSGVLRGVSSQGTVLVVVTLILVLTSATLLVQRETGAGFDDFSDALWFSVFSLIAGEPVGGEPTTELGRWTTLVLMVGGLTVFGMFVGTVSATMAARLEHGIERYAMDPDELSGHILVFGWNNSAAVVLHELHSVPGPAALDVVVVTELADKPEDWPRELEATGRLYYHHGDYTRMGVLTAIAAQRASKAILLTDARIPRSDQDKDARTVLAALTLEHLRPEIRVIAELTSGDSEDLLRARGVEEVVVGDSYAGMILGSASRNPGLVRVLDDILSARSGNAFHTVQVPGDSPLAGGDVEGLRRVLGLDHHAILVSIEHGRRVTDDGVEVPGDVRVNPESSEPVHAGDWLVLISRDPVRLG